MRISVPASSANLGPGFDCLGLALDIRLTARATWGAESVKLHDFDDPLDWWFSAVQPYAKYSGSLAPFAKAHDTEPNLFATSFVKAILNLGPEYHLPPKLECEITSDIAIGQGLGSSAAANVAGAALALFWAGHDSSHERAFETAVEIEGHADNAAAATFGSLQAALLYGRKARAKKLPMHESLRVALAIPSRTLKEGTNATRRWLPEQLKRTDAISNQRALLTLLYGLEHGDQEAIAAGFEDRLHVPHRKGMILGFDEIVKGAIDAGAFGATISGAGGSVIAIGVGDMAPVADAMKAAFERHGMTATACTPEIDQKGLIVEAG